MFISNTNHGDLNLLIDSHFGTSLGPLTDKESYQKALVKIGEQSEGVIFQTKSPEEAKAAKEIGITPILVVTHRRNIQQPKLSFKRSSAHS
jgi:methionine salvage enolase-phosphatase E1